MQRLYELQGLFEFIDAAEADLFERLVSWSGINSGSYNLDGLAAMAANLVSLYTPLADTAEQIDLADREILDDQGRLQTIKHGCLLSFSKRPEAPIQVLLVGHMDTVFPADSAFQSATLVDKNTLHGPGVADMKGGLLVMYQALSAWEQHPLAEQLGWRVVINPDEETGSIASAPWLAQYAGRADFGMVYEPALADGTLAGERKGSGNFSIKVTGRSAHAGREFHLGRNAIAALAVVLVELNQLNALAEREAPGVTVNIGRVSGGGPVNVVPDTAVAHFNVRLSEVAHQNWFSQQLENIVQRCNDQEGIQIEVFGGFTRAPKPSNKAHQLLCRWLSDCGETLGVAVGFKATGGCCDGNNLAAAGLPNIDTLGVRGGQIHTAQEFMLVDSLTERAKLSLLLLDRAVRDAEQLRALKTTNENSI